MKRLIVLLALPAFLLVGCGSDEGSIAPGNTPVEVDYNGAVKVDVDGTECVIYKGENGRGGISCDWSDPAPSTPYSSPSDDSNY